MWISLFVRRRAFASRSPIAALAVALGVVGLAATIPALKEGPAGEPASAPAAAANVDTRFVPLGQYYLPLLGKAYAAGWVEGAKALEAGQSVDAALGAVGKAWDGQRTALFDRLLTPQFHRIVPEGQDDAATKAADKLALARAWRGFARGLDPQSK